MLSVYYQQNTITWEQGSLAGKQHTETGFHPTALCNSLWKTTGFKITNQSTLLVSSHTETHCVVPSALFHYSCMLTPKIVNPLLTLQEVLGYLTSICSLVQAAWSSAGVSLSLWVMWPWGLVYTSVGSEPEDRGCHGMGGTWRSVLLHRLRGWWVSGWNKVKGMFVKSSCC